MKIMSYIAPEVVQEVKKMDLFTYLKNYERNICYPLPECTSLQEMKIKAVNETVYATAGVHIRESYTTDSKVLGSLAKGASIQRTGVCENGWSRVQYESKDAYIYGEYLTTKKPEKDAPAAKTNGKPPATMQEGDKPKPVQLFFVKHFSVLSKVS